MRIKVSEATVLQLNWMVALAEGQRVGLRRKRIGDLGYFCKLDAVGSTCGVYSPVTDWAQGGPIAERENIGCGFHEIPQGLGGDKWIAAYPTTPKYEGSVWTEGTTELVAKMRCFVVSRLGDEVELPEECI